MLELNIEILVLMMYPNAELKKKTICPAWMSAVVELSKFGVISLREINLRKSRKMERRKVSFVLEIIDNTLYLT